MPISKQNQALYPSDWKTVIRPRILARANNCCEECGVANYALGARDIRGTWRDEAEIDGLNGDMGDFLFDGEYPTIIKIVLTIAHLDHDVTNNSDDNLKALCQLHHLRHDAQHHAETRRTTLLQKKLDTATPMGF